ncbi:uncharacterized protein K444DRAFT_614085, partial [Hyaloscypha bicolor E]
MLDLGVRYTLLVIYLVLSDNSFSKELEPVDLTLTTLEMLGMFTSVVLINDTFILVLVMKIVAVLEVLKFLICVALAVHLALSFNSLAKLCLAIFLLSVYSVSGGFKCWYGYHIISPPREPILSNPRGNDTTIHMDSYNENQGPLSVAYQCQKEQRQEWNYHRVSEDQVSCSEEDQLFEQASASSHCQPFHPRVSSRFAENATLTALSSLQSESSQERRRSIVEPVSRKLEAQDHNTAPSARLPFQTYPHFHPRTRYLQSTLLDVTVRSAIILTTLELVLAIHFIFIALDVGLSLNRDILFPALASIGLFVTLKLTLIQIRAVFLVAPSSLFAIILRFFSVLECENCIDARTMSLIHILSISLQFLNLCAHLAVPIAMVSQYIELRCRKCTCCGLSECLRNEVALGSLEYLPYSEWKHKKLSAPNNLRL